MARLAVAVAVADGTGMVMVGRGRFLALTVGFEDIAVASGFGGTGRAEVGGGFGGGGIPLVTTPGRDGRSRSVIAMPTSSSTSISFDRGSITMSHLLEPG